MVGEGSLIMGKGGGATKREGRQFREAIASEVFSPTKVGIEKVLAMLKGGTKGLEVVLTQELEVLAIPMAEA